MIQYEKKDGTSMQPENVEVPVKKKVEIAVPKNSEVTKTAKRVLRGSAGINVVEKHKLEKPHFMVMGGAIVAMLIVLLITSMVNGNRQSKMDALASEINKLNNQLTIQASSGSYREKAQEQRGAVGYDKAQVSHDTELIRTHLSSMLTWNMGDRETRIESIRATYALPSDNTFVGTFFPGGCEASTFLDCTAYSLGNRNYLCEVAWEATYENGSSGNLSAVFVCSVASDGAGGEKLINLEAYRNADAMTIMADVEQPDADVTGGASGESDEIGTDAQVDGLADDSDIFSDGGTTTDAVTGDSTSMSDDMTMTNNDEQAINE